MAGESVDSIWSSKNLPERVTCRELLSACAAAANTNDVFLPAGVLQRVQQTFFGSAVWLDRRACHGVNSNDLWSSANAYLASLPPLCAILASILENDTQALKSKDVCVAVLRDLNASFDVLWKLPTQRMHRLFVQGGMCKEDSDVVALAVFSRKRRQTTNKVEELSRVERAVCQFNVFDEHVSLANCQLDDGELEALSNTIVKDSQLTSLDLGGNNIHKSGGDVVARIVSKLPKLRALRLCGNNLLRAGCERVVVECAKLQQLQRLDISGCHGGPKLCQTLVGALDGHCSLIYLNLASNDLSNLNAFPKLPKLRGLDLSSNRLRTDDVAALRVSLGSSLLASIELNNNLINDEGATKLVELATELKSLRSIGVSFNPIGDEGMTALLALFDRGVKRIAAENTFASCGVVSELASKNAAKIDETNKRVATLRRTPLAQWSADDVEIVCDVCIEDEVTKLLLHGFDGNQWSSSRNLQFNLSDWSRLAEFQEKI